MSLEIKSYMANKVGKDYVVGDIHGEFRKLKILLDSINFDSKKDRLFSVGDLCDRGQNSEDLLEWMNYEWFIPVMGNHEVMIINHFYGYLKADYMRRLKADWFLELKEDEKQSIIKYFHNLPVGIEIIKEHSKIGIVHAMCPVTSWQEFKDKLTMPSEKQEMANKAMWSFLAETKIEYVSDVEAIIVGHNTVEKFHIQENTYLLDTGSGYKDGKLTILDVQTMQPVKLK